MGFATTKVAETAEDKLGYDHDTNTITISKEEHARREADRAEQESRCDRDCARIAAGKMVGYHMEGDKMVSDYPDEYYDDGDDTDAAKPATEHSDGATPSVSIPKPKKLPKPQEPDIGPIEREFFNNLGYPVHGPRRRNDSDSGWRTPSLPGEDRGSGNGTNTPW
jgi:hypothetical protein